MKPLDERDCTQKDYIELTNEKDRLLRNLYDDRQYLIWFQVLMWIEDFKVDKMKFEEKQKTMAAAAEAKQKKVTVGGRKHA